MFIPCQAFDREESQVLSRLSFPKVNTGPDMHTHALKHTHYNIAPRGLGHPADSILFPLDGSCVTKNNLVSLWHGYLRGIWMPPWLTCGLRFLCFVLRTSLPSSFSPPPLLPLCSFFASSGLQRVSWEPGWLPWQLVPPSPLCTPTSVPSGGTSELAVISPLIPRLATHWHAHALHIHNAIWSHKTH